MVIVLLELQSQKAESLLVGGILGVEMLAATARCKSDARKTDWRLSELSGAENCEVQFSR
jgi:hypothetical protein